MIVRNLPVFLLELFTLIKTRGPKELVVKSYRLWRREGLRGIYRIFAIVNYERWIKKNDLLVLEDRKKILSHIDTFERYPVISILMPVYNAPEKWLRMAIESVRRQLYPYWELCIADDASTEPHVAVILNEVQKSDPRIKVTYRDLNGHISAASNSALDLVTGEFVALLDQDDELAEHAIYMVVAALNEKPHIDLIYSDEDKIDESGKRFGPYFKPDWNPDLFLAQNMVSHLGVYRTGLIRKIGGFREGFEGSQDWDLALRISEIIPASNIYHIPHVLYHWRAISGSTAANINGKPYAIGAGMASVREHLNRIGSWATVSMATATGSGLRIRFPLPTPFPLVSIIIPTRNGLNLLIPCIDSLSSKTDYSPFEIIIVDNQSYDPHMMKYLAMLDNTGIARVLHYNKSFNYSAINNFAVRQASGDLICLLNNDVEAISRGWLEEMVSQAIRPEIGVVGAMLYYPNDRIQHAGVVVGVGGVAGHPYRNSARGIPGYMGRASLAQNLSAVTGACMVMRKSIYEETGGLDEVNLPVAFNDVDFCLKVMERGYRNLWTPFAELYHHEYASRGSDDTPSKQLRFQREVSYMRLRWSHIIDHDPAYNPNLALDNGWPYLAITSRATKPWLSLHGE